MISSKNRKVISIEISVITYLQALADIISLGRSRTPSYVCFANVHMAIEAYKSEAFALQVNNAKLVLADGMPLVNTLSLLYGIKQERVAGMDIFPDLIKEASINNLNLFFFGTTTEVLAKIEERIGHDYPKANIVGLCSPPFNTSLDDESYITQINESKANLVFVALGCPKQEKWMATHSHKINAVLLGVGGAFPVYAGITSRAPLILQKLSLEWVYRLYQEPRRLFKRYFTTNTLFIYLVLKTKIMLSSHKVE